MEVTFCPELPDVTENIAFFEGSQVLPARPSDKSAINMKTGIEH
jgi:hypothetical protein